MTIIGSSWNHLLRMFDDLDCVQVVKLPIFKRFNWMTVWIARRSISRKKGTKTALFSSTRKKDGFRATISCEISTCSRVIAHCFLFLSPRKLFCRKYRFSTIVYLFIQTDRRFSFLYISPLLSGEWQESRGHFICHSHFRIWFFASTLFKSFRWSSKSRALAS